MSALPALPPLAYEGMSVAEYFAFEAQSRDKHDYWNGRMYAMTGGTINHNRIVSNAITVLDRKLEGAPCELFPTDLRIQIVAVNVYTYPDVSVACEPLQFYKDRRDTITNPRLLIEVLSPSTEDYDRCKKFVRYRLIPSLEEYVIISSTQVLIEVYRRLSTFQWALSVYTSPDDSITFSSIGVTLTAAELYRNVDFSLEGQPEA